MSTRERWAGGRKRTANGVTTYYIRRRLGGGARVEIPVATDESDALAEWSRFKDDPAGYQSPRERAVQAHHVRDTGEVRIDAPTIEVFLEHCDILVAREDMTQAYRDQTLEPYLLWWSTALRGRDLRRLSLEDLRAALKQQKTARRKRIVALKSFTSWAREEKDAPKLHRKDDPTIDLKTPPVIAGKAVDARGYPMELIQKLYAELPSQSARDMICLRAKLGLHDTEISRIAEGKGVLRRVSDPSGIEGVVIFAHLKKGKPHAVSCDAQSFAACERLQVRGEAISRNALKVMVDRACRRLGLKAEPGKPAPIQPGQLRHSFATWATTVGEEVHALNQRGVDLAKVSEHMGHLSKRTTSVFYVGDRVPMMIRLPLKLEHPNDPVELASSAPAKRRDQREEKR